MAAVGGLGLADLAGLFAEIYQRSQADEAAEDAGEPGHDHDHDETFADRALRLVTTFGGAGVLHGDLTPECTAAVQAVLDALSAPAGAEDTRSQEQRCHDALQEAMRRLAAAGMVPERAGQPVKVWVHIPLAELLQMEGSTTLMKEWVAAARAAWAAHRAEASESGSDGTDAGGPAAASPDTTRAWEAIEQAVIGKAVDLLSGPGGLASFLRRRQLGARLGGPSLPLDIGYAETIPAGIRNAVILRDKHCRWAGGCHQPAAACEVHHIKHKADGGKTSTKDCVLLCFFLRDAPWPAPAPPLSSMMR